MQIFKLFKGGLIPVITKKVNEITLLVYLKRSQYDCLPLAGQQTQYNPLVIQYLSLGNT